MEVCWEQEEVMEHHRSGCEDERRESQDLRFEKSQFRDSLTSLFES